MAKTSSQNPVAISRVVNVFMEGSKVDLAPQRGSVCLNTKI